MKRIQSKTKRELNANSFYFRAFKWSSQIFVYSFPFIIYPLNNISFCGSIFTTVALAYERYIAVCRPLHYRDVTARYTVRRRTLRLVNKYTYISQHPHTKLIPFSSGLTLKFNTLFANVSFDH